MLFRREKTFCFYFYSTLKIQNKFYIIKNIFLCPHGKCLFFASFGKEKKNG